MRNMNKTARVAESGSLRRRPRTFLDEGFRVKKTWRKAGEKK